LAGASKSKRLQIGDQIVSMSASWGDRLWEVNSVESFAVGVKMRSGKSITLKLKRFVTMAELSGADKNDRFESSPAKKLMTQKCGNITVYLF
jgi:hypothetical protein